MAAKTKSEPKTPEKIKHNKTALGVFAAIIILFVFVYFFKGLFVAATVNGEQISRIAVIREIEKQNGKATLESLITKKLILQDAKKNNISITQADIEGEINKISANLKNQGTTLDKALEAQGMTRTQLNEEIKIQLIIQKATAIEPKITDKEINDYIETNKSLFPEGTTDAQIKEQSIAQLKQEKQQQKTQEYIKNLQDSSKTIYFIKY